MKNIIAKLENKELKKRISNLEDDIQMIKEMLGKK